MKSQIKYLVDTMDNNLVEYWYDPELGELLIDESRLYELERMKELRDKKMDKVVRIIRGKKQVVPVEERPINNKVTINPESDENQNSIGFGF